MNEAKAPSTAKPCVVLGLLGTTLDGDRSKDRWSGWRPTVSICRQPDFVINRFELIHPTRWSTLAQLVQKDIHAVSPETTVVLQTVDTDDPWDFELVYEKLFQFARAYPFDTEKEDYFIHITTGTHVAQICLFLLTESRYLPGKLLQASPERDRTAPGTIKIIDLDLSAYDRIAQRRHQETRDAVSYLKGGIDTRNAAFNTLIDRIEQVAIATRDPLLLMGPTGAGKSKLARRIFELKKMRHTVTGEFIDVNCATLRGDGAMSTLFGHVKGAFTGALKDRPGVLRAADKGMLFLDEIGELGSDEQAMLLRALEEKTFLPLGSDREVRSDFQLIAGTNRDLLAAVREGRFREDLLSRINLWSFTLPGLKDRPEDIEPNLQFELDQYAERASRQVTFSTEAKKAFLDFALSPEAQWTGNFRELNGAVVRMATLAHGGRISVDTVQEELTRLRASWESPGATDAASESAPEKIILSALSLEALDQIDPFDRVQLARVIEVCRASRTLSDAGRKLYASSRTRKSSSNDADRLRKYLSRFALDFSSLT
jgi:transcriptional regulatory protein RtcR